jgi:formylglycine-generating enzyme required for sulfatase activity
MLADLKPSGYSLQDGRYRELLDKVLSIFDREQSAAVELRTRIEAAEALGQAGDPRLRENNWVRIPEGVFVMGEGQGAHEVELSAYEIGKYPVTVEEFARYVEDGGAGPEDWDKQVEYPNRPVVGVSWREAVVYCQWRGVRLPTDAEWERAARGVEGRVYPWGSEEPDPSRANYRETNVGAPTPVGLFPRGATPEGICDLAGNVYEWVSDWYREYPKGEQKDPPGLESGSGRVLRGGAWGSVPWALSTAGRGWFEPGDRVDFGLRCARKVPTP